jgi:capsular exopolysaccharide synthesis family protein
MSRVDEALRRAAEAARRQGRHDTEGVVDSPWVAPSADPATLALEPFPDEGPDAAPAPAPAAPIPVAARAPEPAAAARIAHDIPDPPSLFERLDTRLAAKVVVDRMMRPASREQYRRLAASLHQKKAAAGVKVIMVASALVGEGKTLTASNLALTLSESYKRTVLLIDADLRRPSLHSLFRTNGTVGLSEGLAAVDEPKLQVFPVSERLSVLPAGAPTTDPMAGLTSPRMKRLIDEARRLFDWVIIDTPPVGLMTDASLMASMVDGALLVVQAGSTPFDIVKRAVETLGPDHVLGVVLNRATMQTPEDSYGYGGYPAYEPLTEPDSAF